ncbi:hypothetical protein PENCOP_c002G03614 [Penicillium coprophilum]|uniref:Ubiquitin-like domain-containing protein n=1 Tax=Penicillium coprophilum TaxID=36646 RepID=A0A1V6V2V0_9EURO|nr:hypothetical protein PENCOP_c002G03614 [Penicillium coprophilum]
MVPAFGFGVGDFVAVATLVWKLSQALSETSEDSKLYRECQLEFQNMQHLQQQMRDGTQSLNLQLQAGTEQLKLHIDNVVQDPWDQKPIRFQDATGRRYPVPLEVCGTFEGFTDFLQHAFKDSPILNAVQQQSIWLFTPVLGQPKNWILITAEDWQLSVCPGMQLGMSVFAGRRVTNGPVSDLLSEIPEDDAVKLQTPLPLWASSSFFEDARFRPR